MIPFLSLFQSYVRGDDERVEERGKLVQGQPWFAERKKNYPPLVRNPTRRKEGLLPVLRVALSEV